MVASISGGLSTWADSVFSKLDTKKQGYIEKTDLQSALSATDDGGTRQTPARISIARARSLTDAAGGGWARV